jgi:hypothetical protein
MREGRKVAIGAVKVWRSSTRVLQGWDSAGEERSRAAMAAQKRCYIVGADFGTHLHNSSKIQPCYLVLVVLG